MESVTFAPEEFFLGSTQGGGLVRDFAGRLIDRCQISTQGWWDDKREAMYFDETFVYESGRVDIMNWTVAPDADGSMVAALAGAPAPVRAWIDGGDYRIRFRRRGETPLPSIYLTFDTRFSVMAPDSVLKVARVKLYGFTLGVLTAFQRKLEA
jgi:hypothetical protein